MKPADRVEPILERVLAEKDEHEGRPGTDLLRLWRTYLRPVRGRMMLALVVSAIWAFLPFCFALTAKYFFDEVLVAEDGKVVFTPERLRGVWIVFGMNMGLWTLMLATQYLRSWLIVEVGLRLVHGLRKDLHKKLQALHIGYYERTPTGRIVSRVLDDVNVLYQWVVTHAMHIVSSLAKLIPGLCVAYYLNWRLATMILVSLPFYAWAFAALRPKIRRVNIAMRRLNSTMYARSEERINGIRVIQAFAREKGEIMTFAKLQFENLRVTMRQVLYAQGLSLIAGFVTAITTTAVIYVGMREVRAGTLSLGGVIAFMSILPQFFEPINMLTTLASAMQAMFVVLRRVLALLDEPEELPSGAIHLTGMKGKVTFEDVVFTYPGQDEPVLNGISVRIQAGERVALMGPSGSGKSTIFQLLMRFYDPQQGTVRVGGVNLRDADSGSVRRHVRMVQQEPVIFSGTLAANVMYGMLDASPSMIMKAAQRAELHGFIMSLPLKYETEVGENGITLSGGQKQRLALATALLTDPEILLLDDTTSALDAQTEARIRETLNKVLEGRTSLTITQRVATARHCDRIIVLEKGRITQMGSHDELMREEGFYKRICQQQESM